MSVKQIRHANIGKLAGESKTAAGSGPVHLNIKGANLAPYNGADLAKLDKLAKILRGLIFVTVEAAQSGHPGGSSSKVEQFLALTLGGELAFDPADPKHPGRDRVVWSAGHCTPLLFSGQALLYESLRRTGRQFSEAVLNCALPEHLLQFRRINGLPGHAESQYPLCDYCSGPSGHGFSAAGGVAISHRASNLPTKVWVFMGDAESEEGMTFEARNVLAATGTDNIIVSLDYNHYGIDGPIEEVIAEPYHNYWRGLGWNVIEADGHNINELLYAYSTAAKGFNNKRPTVIIAHTQKGRAYGCLENTADSHGSPAARGEYVKLMKKLGFNIPANTRTIGLDMEAVLDNLSEDDCVYVESALDRCARRIESEAELSSRMKQALNNRPLVDPRSIERPSKLPPELVFKQGKKASMRKAAEAWFAWMAKETAFFYAGAGDLSKSVLTGAAEKIYGLISRSNPYGRGLRFGIAEANMAMMSAALTQDVLPGGFRPVSVFGTYGVFSAIYAHQVHLALINNYTNPQNSGFFIALATHDGPETGEDGPTHQGLFWMSAFAGYPGIKIYKPADANEVIEILFASLEKGEPIVLALPRVETMVLERKRGVSLARSAALGAYIYRNYAGSGKPKAVAVISGAVILENTIEALPVITKKLDLKIIVATSPKAFMELQKLDPAKAAEILNDKEKQSAVTLHNGWNGFLDELIMPLAKQKTRFGIEHFLASGSAEEVVAAAGFDAQTIADKIISSFI